MKKRLLSLLLCVTMLTAGAYGCGKNTEENKGNEEIKAVPTAAPKEEVKGEALPESKYYFSFDKADGTNGIIPTGQDKTGDPILFPVEKDITFIPGVKGEAVYVDGSSGLRLDVNGVGDTYTVSFWVYATRFANYMPTVQFGPDVHGDATGNQHYLNITRSEWNPDGPSFPCVWAYDQADDGLWPNWAPKEAGEHLKEWMNITIVVDPGKLSEDGNMIVADLYVNGTLVDGSPVHVVNGTMTPSDNFDFLLGVNYWDAIFKGAFDELYIFDKALTAGQALTLYKAGNPSVKFEEPERIIVVKPEKDAVARLGTTDYKAMWGEEVFEACVLKDGESKKIKLHNWSDGKDTKNNYGLLFTKDESTNPAKEAFAIIYADAEGTLGNGLGANTEFTYSWGNWKTWKEKAMVDVTTTVTLERDGSVIYITADNVDFNASSNLMKCTLTTWLEDADDAVVYITAQNAYVDVISVMDTTVGAITGTVVGNTDLTQGFWQAFSDIWSVPAGTSKTVNFTNYTDGVNNWDNFVVVLQKTATGHAAADVEGYGEYAVFRADNYGWGDGYADTTASCDWNWDTFKEDMFGAKVALTVTNNGTTADTVAVVTTKSGKTYTQSYTGTPISGDLFFTLTLEAAYLVIDPVIVGHTDLTQGFWQAFSDIWAVPAGTSKTVNFTNYTDGVNNWDNFVVVLQKTATGHAATDVEGYGEYAVFRADNYGWGDGYAATAASCDWNWDTFKEDMYGAEVALTVTNNGTTADTVAVVTTKSGKTYTQSYIGTPISGDLFFTLTLEAAYLVIK